MPQASTACALSCPSQPPGKLFTAHARISRGELHPACDKVFTIGLVCMSLRTKAITDVVLVHAATKMEFDFSAKMPGL